MRAGRACENTTRRARYAISGCTSVLSIDGPRTNFSAAGLLALSERASITISRSPCSAATSSITVPAARLNSPRCVVPRLRISKATSVRFGSSVYSAAAKLSGERKAPKAMKPARQLPLECMGGASPGRCHRSVNALTQPSVAPLRATRCYGGIVGRLARTSDAGAICPPVLPLRIAPAQQVPDFLARPGEIGLADAAIPGNEPAGETVRALIRKIRRQFFPQHRFHAGVTGARRTRRAVLNGGASGKIRYRHQRPNEPREIHE